MNFGKVLSALNDRFESSDIGWVLVGGVALTMHGIPRVTLDIDVMVDGERQTEVLAILDDLGFHCLHSSSGYSNHKHTQPGWGRVDVLYVRGETRQRILGSPSRMMGPGRVKVPVAKPEHLIAMKVFAIRQNPERRRQDLADIRALADIAALSSEKVQAVFERYEAEDLWERYQK